MKLNSFGLYKLDNGNRVPLAVVNILAPAMYKLLKRLEWENGLCIMCGCFQHAEHCLLRNVLAEIDGWDQTKYSLTMADYERLQEIK